MSSLLYQTFLCTCTDVHVDYAVRTVSVACISDWFGATVNPVASVFLLKEKKGKKLKNKTKQNKTRKKNLIKLK